ncbi:50S ribosomal protein L29 [Hazenella coriacea]|uniref:Large ribosomal subunit protein uL29 n=1 Tax=Hazenella coriacea TaxID=1179467 RepID=A0A4R3L3R4_9BACL|nr:50S ribosomal protein L29 [Hazenella coriacea]TCS94179.1 LSU ribosomal protein L29P [Hazenella coriacea]
MKAKELIELTTAEIEQKIATYKEELFNLRFQSVTGQLENPARLSQVRKNIARCKTVLRERELGIEERRKQG